VRRRRGVCLAAAALAASGLPAAQISAIGIILHGGICSQALLAIERPALEQWRLRQPQNRNGCVRLALRWLCSNYDDLNIGASCWRRRVTSRRLCGGDGGQRGGGIAAAPPATLLPTSATSCTASHTHLFLGWKDGSEEESRRKRRRRKEGWREAEVPHAAARCLCACLCHLSALLLRLPACALPACSLWAGTGSGRVDVFFASACLQLRGLPAAAVCYSPAYAATTRTLPPSHPATYCTDTWKEGTCPL